MRPPPLHSTTLVDAADAADAAGAAHRRIGRHRLLPHIQRRWQLVAGALKCAQLYDHVVSVPVRADETTRGFTERFATAVASGWHADRRALVVNQGGQLFDGRARGGCECLALPHLQTSVLLHLTGPLRIVGPPQGACVVAQALAPVLVDGLRVVCVTF